MDTLVSELLQFQLSIKILHWQTRSYAKHIATDSLYKSLSDNIDQFVEILQGKYGRVKFSENAHISLINFDKKNDENLIKYIQHWMETELPKMIHKDDTDLLNIRDEMLGNIKQTRYLFSLN